MTREARSAITKLPLPDDDMGVINQIMQDWQTQPFVRLTVEDDFCPLGTKPVFEKIWSGTREGCYQLDVGSGGKDGRGRGRSNAGQHAGPEAWKEP